MTGFAEKKFSFKTFSLKISIRGQNHRNMDWNYRGAQIGKLEDRLRRQSQKQIHRGRLDVFLDIVLLDPSKWNVRINDDLLARLLSSLEKSLAKLNQKFSISVDNIFSIPHIVELKKKEFSRTEESLIEECFQKTLSEFNKTREREGRAIRRELLTHARIIKEAVRRVIGNAKMQPQLVRKKLNQRIRDLGGDLIRAEEKIIAEVSFLAQRYDINEEVERLTSHLDLMREILSPENQGPTGKKLDFVAQEMYREANTINSKAQDIRIVKECLKLKNEVESIRQQVQNLE